MFESKIPKAANCDNTISAVLDDVVLRGEDCIVLKSFKITTTHVELSYDEDHCKPVEEKPAGQ